MKTLMPWISVAALSCVPAFAYAADPTLGTALEDVMANAGPGETATSVRLIVLLTALTLLPGLILAMPHSHDLSSSLACCVRRWVCSKVRRIRC